MSTISPNLPETITLEQTASLLHVSIPRILYWVKKRRIPQYITIGHRRLFLVADLAAFLAKLQKLADQSNK